MNTIINVKEGSEMYNNLMQEMDNITENDLVIIARSFKNRKDDRIPPIEIKNGIYFYVAYDLDSGKTAFISKVTSEQICKAKANMIRRARLGSMMDLCFSSGESLDEFESDGSMNVATLEGKTHGAGLLYCEDFLKAMKKKIGEYYILPSSIHEIIFVPTEICSINDATEMVINVNDEAVTDDVYLADRAFTMNEWI